MKIIRVTLILLIFARSGYCQDDSKIGNTEMDKLKNQIEKEITQIKKELESKDYISEYEKKITIEFAIDTFKIERLLSQRIEIDCTTSGMFKATNEAEVEYDKLLNKYYQILMKKLNESDKELFKQSQRNWIQLRDAERKFNTELAKEVYSGGGSIQNLIIADKNLSITKKRVLDIFEYLTRFVE